MFVEQDEKTRIYANVKEYTELLLAKAKVDYDKSLTETDMQRYQARIRAAYAMLNMLDEMREHYYAKEMG